MADLPGLDLAALARWLDAEQPGMRAGGLHAQVIEGGKSNLTYRVGDGTNTWALRRPPLAHVLPTAHDMSREYRMITALAGTDVPVPAPLALCTDAEVLGAPFYLMSYVDGLVLDQPGRLAGLDPHAARRCCDDLVDTLLRLHAVVPAQVGLGDFGRPEGFLQRQVRRWHGQWQASATRDLPALEHVVAQLSASVPAQPAAAIVHGDYRLTNVIFDADLSGIAAVVDWEMATVGDPLADVGLLLAYQTLSVADDFVMPQTRPEAGFATPGQMRERYARDSPLPMDRLGWYVAFAFFKLAVIAEGIHHRFLDGKTVGSGFERFGPKVPELVEQSLDALDSYDTSTCG